MQAQRDRWPLRVAASQAGHWSFFYCRRSPCVLPLASPPRTDRAGLPVREPALSQSQSLLRQVPQWIGRLAILANFKIQLVPIGTTAAHLGNHLPCRYMLAFLHE